MKPFRDGGNTQLFRDLRVRLDALFTGGSSAIRYLDILV